MTTVADVLSDCRNIDLLAGARESRNKLASDVDLSNDTWEFTYELKGINEGAKLSCDLEDVTVWAANESSRTTTVQRGALGSTAAAHTAGTIVTVNSSFPDSKILRAVNMELGALSSRANGLYRMRSVDLTYNAALNGYDMTGVTSVLSVWQVRYKATGSEANWPLIVGWDHQRDMSTAEFASGNALFLNDSGQPGNAVRVWYRSGFAPLVNLTDDVAAVSGLHAEAHDLLSIGAAMRLTAGRETARNRYESQGDTRRASEVPPGASLGAWRALNALRSQRVAEEASRLAGLYPVRI